MARFLAFLGHGRALECHLIGLKLLIGTFIFVPKGELRIIPLVGLTWYVPDQAIAAPFLVIGLVQLVGLVMNMRGHERSWVPRLLGAGAGAGMWAWLITSSVLQGAIASFVLPVSVMGIVSSSFLIYKAKNRLPIPGQPGLI